MRYIIIFLLLNLAPCVQAAELFGVGLASASKPQLTSALKTAGVKPLSKATDDPFYDAYQGNSVIHGAARLYLGFVKQSQRFAFAEYEFNGFKHPQMLQRLNQKYGKADQISGKFISDRSYSWLSDGIRVTFYQDWRAYKTRLIYIHPESLQQLKAERQASGLTLLQQKMQFLAAAY